jgi:hypothetical protein
VGQWLVWMDFNIGRLYCDSKAIGRRRGAEEIAEELDDRAVSALWRAIAEVKQRSVIGWVTKNLLFRAPLCFGRHVKPLVPEAYAVVSTNQSALGPRGG